MDKKKRRCIHHFWYLHSQLLTDNWASLFFVDRWCLFSSNIPWLVGIFLLFVYIFDWFNSIKLCSSLILSAHFTSLNIRRNVWIWKKKSTIFQTKWLRCHQNPGILGKWRVVVIMKMLHNTSKCLGSRQTALVPQFSLNRLNFRAQCLVSLPNARRLLSEIASLALPDYGNNRQWNRSSMTDSLTVNILELRAKSLALQN